ncbi:MAG: hypothetical protein QG670_850 [Thermoproteota archaeon]|nr:hypothetical protein [Thermoproteota archaeon]
MINSLGLTIKYDLMTDLSIGKRYLRALDQVPPSVWEAVEEFALKLARERAINIPRFNVSQSTQNWRKKKAKSDTYKVETHRGEFKKVLAGPRVGKRTSTFVDDLRESRAPYIEYGIGSEGSEIINGTFKYQIHAEDYVYNYPGNRKGFLGYLIKKGIVPEGGYMAMDTSQEEAILDMLEIEVSKYLGLEWEKLTWTGGN